MLSIIICSKNEYISKKLQQNIIKTIGTEYELIVIDNSKNEYSIFEAYNKGISLAKYPFLCFVHEDVLFHKKNWGNKAIEHLKIPNTGIVGMAGSQYLPNVPASWFNAKPIYRNLIQSGYKDGKSKTITFTEQKVEVVAIDGFCFFMNATIFNQVQFDDKTFSGFHCYDLDICMQVREKGFQIYAVNNILTEHTSIGSLNESWLQQIVLFYKKWGNQFPVEIKNFKRPLFSDIKGLKKTLRVLKKNNCSHSLKNEVCSIAKRKMGLSYYIANLLS